MLQGSVLGLILVDIFSSSLDENRLYVIKIQSTYKNKEENINNTLDEMIKIQKYITHLQNGLVMKISKTIRNVYLLLL